MSSSTPELAWFKSSYSGGDGDSCVEIALSWHKSSYSGDSSGDCIEIAACPTTVHIRDSKDKDGPQLAVPAHAWATFVSYAAEKA
ncbi:DUF397 domain-containing protein [Streptomyces sp. NRRL S-337]|uniref:DUF397 domain-containing protein n=1 Tax=Streptomyces sp. NRRL S-337 TaxID=1463900 RepID=UPI0004C7855D|nr:DUF397 domain-containing protein [Streptomyces sp. NRRL S-337]